MDSIKRIKIGLFSRNWQLTKMAGRAILPLLKNRSIDPHKLFKDFIGKDVEKWPKELGMLKGSLLKAGQLLSMYSEYFLPEEFRKTLRKLQSSTHYIEFESIEYQFSKEILDLGVERKPFAAASIGQVHLSSDQKYALKVQYPGIKKAIDWDLFFIKQLLKLGNALPQDIDFGPLFDEVKLMLELEMDYIKEAETQKKFYEFYKNHEFVQVPAVNSSISTSKVLVSEYILGETLSSDKVLNLPQGDKNKIGEALLENFLNEIFTLGIVQTDAHGGNYLYSDKKLYLIDFGSVKMLNSRMQNVYKQMLQAAMDKDRSLFELALESFQNDYDFKFELDKDFAWDYFSLATTPLFQENYDWGECTLPDRLMEMAKAEFKNIKVKNPPFHFIFIDRKIAGLYMLLKSLKSQTNLGDMVGKFLS